MHATNATPRNSTNQEPIMTPSKEAKDFAAANGFMIKPVERRYHVMRAGMPLVFVAEVGGYPAALNAMRKWLDTVKTDESIAWLEANAPVETCAGGSLVLPTPGEGPNVTANDFPADHSETEPAKWATKTADEIREDVKAFLEQSRVDGEIYNDLQYGTGTTLDAVAKRMGRDERTPGQSDREYRNKLIYGDPRGMKGVDFQLDGKPWGVLEPVTTDTVPMSRDEMIAPVAAELARIRKAARKSSGKPPGGPWHVMFDGRQLTKPGYPTRAAALAVVRWGYNHPEGFYRNNWRNAIVTVEYHPS